MSALPDEPMPEAVWDQLVRCARGRAGGHARRRGDRSSRSRQPGSAAGADPVSAWSPVRPAWHSSARSSCRASSVAAMRRQRSTAPAGRRPTAAPVRCRPTAYAATQSGTQYEKAALDTQVTRLVAARATFTPTAAPTGDLATASPSPARPATRPKCSPVDDPSVAPMATDPAAAQACLEGYLGVAGVFPLAIDIGRWEGEPAAIIVLPGTEPDLADVWVIDPDCSGPGRSASPLRHRRPLSPVPHGAGNAGAPRLR